MASEATCGESCSEEVARLSLELTTLLNRCYHFKGFVYGKTQFAETRPNAIEVEVIPRQGSKPYCSGCGKRRPGYDKLPERSFQFIPFWGFAVFFRYARRRVDCPTCGVVAELLPWAEGKHHLTMAYMQFLATWARKLSWLEVSRSFHTSWDQVYRSVEWIVQWGTGTPGLGSHQGHRGSGDRL